MARIVGGSIFGEIRGKLAGSVFSRNRAGAYIRQFVVPVNPRTLAQDRARGRFAAAAALWHSLDANVKSEWGAYAESVFSPKIGINAGQFSGFNAHTSLRSVVENGNSINQLYDWSVNGAPLAVQPVVAPFAVPITPPEYQVEPAFKTDVPGISATIEIGSAQVSQDGSHEITLNVDNPGLEGSQVEGFLDPNDNPIGFLFQMSQANPQDGMFYANPYRYTLGYTQIPDTGAAELADLTTITVKSLSNVDASDYQSFPYENQYVKVSAFVVSQHGQLVCVGSKPVKVDSHL